MSTDHLMSTPGAAGVARHALQLDASWTSFAGVQGGLVIGAAVDAARAATGRHPRSASALMMRAVQPGELTLDSGVLRTGRGTSAVSVHGHTTGGGLALVGSVLLSTEPAAGAPDAQGVGPGDLATPAGLFTTPTSAGDEDLLPQQFVPFAQHLEYRPVGATYPMAGGSEALLACWVRVRHGAAPMSRSTVTAVLLDALPPSVMATRTTPVYAATADMSLHLAGPGLAAGEWGRLVQRAHWSDEHTSVDDAVLRDETGRLVAVSRQTRRMISVPS